METLILWENEKKGQKKVGKEGKGDLWFFLSEIKKKTAEGQKRSYGSKGEKGDWNGRRRLAKNKKHSRQLLWKKGT